MTAAAISFVTNADASALAELHGACFPDEPWSAQAWRDLLAMPGAWGLWLPEAGQGQGVLLVREVSDEAEILTLAVAPGYRRRGLAHQLLTTASGLLAQKAVRRLFLEVAADNWAAQALYQKRGFAEVGRRRAYYQRGQQTTDALLLATSLPLP